MGMRKTTIRIPIRTLSGLNSVISMIEVVALVYSDVWAVHRDESGTGDPSWWVVTHVPSGRLVRGGLTRRHAMTVARVVARRYPRWGIRSKLNNPPRRIPHALRQLILES